MQIIVTPEAVIVGAIALVVLIIGSILYYEIPYKKAKRAEAFNISRHFQTALFIADLTPNPFKYHDAKFTWIIAIFFGPLLASYFASAFLGIPSIALIGIFVSIVCVIVFQYDLKQKEHERNEGTTYVPTHILFPEPYGEKGLLLKRMKLIREIALSNNEYEVLVDGAIDRISTFPDYAKLTADEKKNLKPRWLARIKNYHISLFTVIDKYWILLISEHKFVEMKTPHEHEMIDETETIKVPLAPMFLLNVEPTTKVLETTDENSRTIFTDRKMGVFIDLFDLAKRNETLMTGEFSALSKTDALFATYLHLYIENSRTATSMTETEISLEKKRNDDDEKEFELDTDALKAAGKSLNRSFNDADSARRTPWSLGKIGKAGIILIVVLIGIAAFLGYILHP